MKIALKTRTHRDAFTYCHCFCKGFFIQSSHLLKCHVSCGHGGNFSKLVPCRVPSVHFMWPRHQQVWIRATEDRRALTALAQLQPRGDPSGWCRRAAPKARGMSQFILRPRPVSKLILPKLDDGWPESEKDVFQAALRMVVVKDSR